MKHSFPGVAALILPLFAFSAIGCTTEWTSADEVNEAGAWELAFSNPSPGCPAFERDTIPVDRSVACGNGCNCRFAPATETCDQTANEADVGAKHCWAEMGMTIMCPHQPRYDGDMESFGCKFTFLHSEDSGAGECRILYSPDPGSRDANVFCSYSVNLSQK